MNLNFCSRLDLNLLFDDHPQISKKRRREALIGGKYLDQ
jgi:hypothetical protein